MIPAWTDEDLRCLARDHRNDPDVLDLIAGVRRVLSLVATWECGNGFAAADSVHAAVCPDCTRATAIRSALNDPPNGA